MHHLSFKLFNLNCFLPLSQIISHFTKKNIANYKSFYHSNTTLMIFLPIYHLSFIIISYFNCLSFSFIYNK